MSKKKPAAAPPAPAPTPAPPPPVTAADPNEDLQKKRKQQGASVQRSTILSDSANETLG